MATVISFFSHGFIVVVFFSYTGHKVTSSYCCRCFKEIFLSVTVLLTDSFSCVSNVVLLSGDVAGLKEGRKAANQPPTSTKVNSNVCFYFHVQRIFKEFHQHRSDVS